MADLTLVDAGDVVMTGENSFMRLSADGGATIVDRASHWRVLWSPAGQGHVLFIEGSLVGDQPRIFTDNPAVARYIQSQIETLLHPPFGDESLPFTHAEFDRRGSE